ncbi:MAG: sigma-70 family RNA polymerase sigma factor [Planctomycetota bacterium]
MAPARRFRFMTSDTPSTQPGSADSPTGDDSGNESPSTPAYEFVQRMIHGSESAWARFVHDYGSTVRSRVAIVARRFDCDDSDLIAQVTAEVFSAFVQNDFAALRAYSPLTGLPTYVAVLATRSATRLIAVTLQKRNSEHIDQSPLVQIAQDPDPARRLMTLDRRVHLEPITQHLSPQHRELVQAFYYKGRTYREIQHATGVPIDSIDAVVREAESCLRKHLRNEVSK